jgi:hypothetical protein
MGCVAGQTLKREFPMTDRKADFVERAESATEKLYGKEIDVDEMAETFALYGLKKRAAALENFDAELCGEVDASPHNLRRRVQMTALRKKMGSLHEALCKAKR